jgi:hypothetical protein
MDYHVLFGLLFVGGGIFLVILFPALLGKGWRIDRIGFGGGKAKDCGRGGDGVGGGGD